MTDLQEEISLDIPLCQISNQFQSFFIDDLNFAMSIL